MAPPPLKSATVLTSLAGWRTGTFRTPLSISGLRRFVHLVCSGAGRRAKLTWAHVTTVVASVQLNTSTNLKMRQQNKLAYVSRCVKSSPYSTAERRVSELIPVLGSQRAGDVSHEPGGRLPLLSARPAITLATLKRAATNFAA